MNTGHHNHFPLVYFLIIYALYNTQVALPLSLQANKASYKLLNKNSFCTLCLTFIAINKFFITFNLALKLRETYL